MLVSELFPVLEAIVTRPGTDFQHMLEVKPVEYVSAPTA